jgi:transposase
MNSALICVGNDVPKAQLDVAVRPEGQTWSCPNQPGAFAALVARLRALQPTLIVMEATGGLEMPVAAALAAAQLPFAIVNPRRVRDFAKATGQLAKTDRIDAGVLAHFAEAIRPRTQTVPSAAEAQLSSLLARRRQITAMLVAERKRLGSATTSGVRERIASHIVWLDTELDDLETGLQNVIQASPLWRATEDLLRSVPGIGAITAYTLIADLPELGRVNHKQIAALWGVAPLNYDSRRLRGQRHV